MDYIEQRVELLKVQLVLMMSLLFDESRSHSWMVCMAQVRDEINAIMDGKRDS